MPLFISFLAVGILTTYKFDTPFFPGVSFFSNVRWGYDLFWITMYIEVALWDAADSEFHRRWIRAAFLLLHFVQEQRLPGSKKKNCTTFPKIRLELIESGFPSKNITDSARNKNELGHKKFAMERKRKISCRKCTQKMTWNWRDYSLCQLEIKKKETLLFGTMAVREHRQTFYRRYQRHQSFHSIAFIFLMNRWVFNAFPFRLIQQQQMHVNPRPLFSFKLNDDGKQDQAPIEEKKSSLRDCVVDFFCLIRPIKNSIVKNHAESRFFKCGVDWRHTEWITSTYTLFFIFFSSGETTKKGFFHVIKCLFALVLLFFRIASIWLLPTEQAKSQDSTIEARKNIWNRGI